MKIVVNATLTQYNQFLAKGIAEGISVIKYSEEKEMNEADAWFDLLFEEEEPAFPHITEQPVFVNAVIKTNKELPANYIRINAWNGFFERGLLEIVDTGSAFCKRGEEILQAMGWKYQPVPDTPGMISARVVAMIINEAYFGLGEEISTKTDIDTAMKAGTNYPYGPFEWSQKIGLQRIYALLRKLNEEDERYEVASALEKEVHGS